MTNRLVFKTLKVQNFFSVGPEARIDFLEHPGMNYVFGFNRDTDVKNGCGKSTIFVDAILFVLFGKTSKGVNKPNIPNRISRENCLVTLTMDVNGASYEVQSGVNPTFVKVWKNGVEVTKSGVHETYEFIEKEVIRTSFNIFKNTIVLAVGETRNLFSMSKYDKRLFVEQLFGLSLLGNMYRRVNGENNTLDKELSIERERFNGLDRDVRSFKKRMETFDVDQTQKIDALSVDVAALSGEIEQLDTDNSSLLESERSWNERKTQLETAISKVDVQRRELLTRQAANKQDVKHGRDFMEKHSEMLSIICDGCKEVVSKKFELERVKKEIEDREAEMRNREAEIASVENREKELKNAFQVVRSKTLDIRECIKEIEKNRLKKDMLEIRLKEKVADLEKEKTQVSPFAEMIEKYQVDSDISMQSIRDMSVKKKHLDFLSFAFSEHGVKRCLVSDLINVANRKIQSYLEEMGCEYTALMDPDFNFTFLTTSGPCEYFNFSAGERRRIDIACIFAFRDILFGQGTLQSNVLVCDEILDISIDETCISSVIRLLRAESDRGQKVFVISHRDTVDRENDFENIIELEKKGGFTSIVSDPAVEGGQK